MTRQVGINFSGIDRQTIVGKVLRRLLAIVPPDLEVRVLQGKLRGARWIVGSGVHGYWLGTYEWEKRCLMETIIEPGDVVYDIGANVGFYTLLMSRLVGPHGRVVAFEPLPRNIQFLRRHIALNHAINVAVYEAAVSDEPGLARFDIGGHTSMGHMSEQGQLEVAAVTLDHLLEDEAIPPPRIIKMDIEGGEAGALRGALELLRRFQPSILLATHGPAIHATCCALLNDLGYSLRPLDSAASLQNTDEVVAMKAPLDLCAGHLVSSYT
jgi:FkbM family methyltransferase